MDFITDLPPSKRGDSVYTTVLVIVDRYSKIVIFVLTTKQYNIVELVDIFINKVVRYYGVPAGIISNRGLVFTRAY